MSLYWIEELPKTDLHIHLDGSLRLRTLIDLAKKSNVELPTTYPPALIKKLKFDQKYTSLEDCLKVFNLTTTVMQTKYALRTVAYELVEDAYCENIEYMEVRFAPHLHTNKKLTSEEVLNSILYGIKIANKNYDVETKIIICGIRNLSPKLSTEMAELAVAYKDKGVVGFDLAGAENGFPPSLHKEALRIARDGKLGITIHAGEAAGSQSIIEALDLGATRIGHGCRVIEDKSLMKRIVNENIVLECCPTSNWQTDAVPDLSKHPLIELYQYGVNITINTDNTLVHNTSINNELELCHTKMRLTESDIKNIVRNGFKAKF